MRFLSRGLLWMALVLGLVSLLLPALLGSLACWCAGERPKTLGDVWDWMMRQPIARLHPTTK